MYVENVDEGFMDFYHESIKKRVYLLQVFKDDDGGITELYTPVTEEEGEEIIADIDMIEGEDYVIKL